jgi:hypothetical protein
MASKKTASRGVVDAALRVARDLEELGASFAIVGGLAVGARAEPRFTRDVDFAVAVDGDEDAERTIRALMARGYRVDVVEHRTMGRLATARLRHHERLAEVCSAEDWKLAETTAREIRARGTTAAARS